MCSGRRLLGMGPEVLGTLLQTCEKKIDKWTVPMGEHEY